MGFTHALIEAGYEIGYLPGKPEQREMGYAHPGCIARALKKVAKTP